MRVYVWQKICKPSHSIQSKDQNRKEMWPRQSLPMSQQRWILVTLYNHTQNSECENTQGFPGGSDSKESACNAGDLGSILRSGRSPGEENGNPLQFLPGEFCGQRSLVGYSPWSCKELDMANGWGNSGNSIRLYFFQVQNHCRWWLQSWN